MHSPVIPEINSHFQLNIDYLRGTIPADRAVDLYWILVDTFGEPVCSELKPQSERGFYDRLMSWPGSSEFWYDSPDSMYRNSHKGRYCLTVHSKVLAGNIARLFRELHQLNYRASRIDVAMDDFSQTMTLEQIHEAVDSGNITGYRRFEILSDKQGSITIAFGRRGRTGSGRYIRAYEHYPEVCRLELELSGRRADDLFTKLSNGPPEQWPGIMAESITSSITFIDRRAKPWEKNLCRIKPLAWWSAIQEELNDF